MRSVLQKVNSSLQWIKGFRLHLIQGQELNNISYIFKPDTLRDIKRINRMIDELKQGMEDDYEIFKTNYNFLREKEVKFNPTHVRYTGEEKLSVYEHLTMVNKHNIFNVFNNVYSVHIIYNGIEYFRATKEHGITKKIPIQQI